MLYNPYLAERVGEERIKDALREAEQARLIRAAEGPSKVREWRLPAVSILSSLLVLFTRPQSRWSR
jgi:hypothetical protein